MVNWISLSSAWITDTTTLNFNRWHHVLIQVTHAIFSHQADRIVCRRPVKRFAPSNFSHRVSLQGGSILVWDAYGTAYWARHWTWLIDLKVLLAGESSCCRYYAMKGSLWPNRITALKPQISVPCPSYGPLLSSTFQ